MFWIFVPCRFSSRNYIIVSIVKRPDVRVALLYPILWRITWSMNSVILSLVMLLPLPSLRHGEGHISLMIVVRAENCQDEQHCAKC